MRLARVEAALTLLTLRCSSSIATLSAPFAAADSSFSGNLQGYRGKARASTTAWVTSTTKEIGAGLADSCAACHGRPRGSAGFGGDVVTRPDSRSAPHLFGLGLKEMLADEMTSDMRAIRTKAVTSAKQIGKSATLPLLAKGVSFGSITGNPNESFTPSPFPHLTPHTR